MSGKPGAVPPAAQNAAGSAARVVWWVLAGAALVVWLVWRALVWLGRLLGFAARLVVEPVDELVTAWLGVRAVLPRVRAWRRRWSARVVGEWRAWRAGAIEGEVMDGVWR
jgi:hypothetical protein